SPASAWRSCGASACGCRGAERGGGRMDQTQQGAMTPLIDGDQVTFVWEGADPPVLTGDFTGWERGTPLPLAPAGPDRWAVTLTLPRDAYLEYRFLRHGEPVPDPGNPRRLDDGVGHTNHWFVMPDFTDTPLAQLPPGGLRGRLTEHSLPTGGYAF